MVATQKMEKLYLRLPGGNVVRLASVLDREEYQIVNPENVDWEYIAIFMSSYDQTSENKEEV